MKQSQVSTLEIKVHMQMNRNETKEVEINVSLFQNKRRSPRVKKLSRVKDHQRR